MTSIFPASTPVIDYSRRFVFENMDARGCYVRLQETLESIQATHHYPENLARVLNLFAITAVLMRDSIKIDGSVTIQLRTPGAIQLIMADCMADKRVRAIAEYDAEELAPSDPIDFSAFDPGAVLAITIIPDEGERYQSIVPIEHPSLQACLEDYFNRSEQLPTWFALFAERDQAVGIAIHALPPRKVINAQQSQEQFDHLKIMLETMTGEEALGLDSQEALTRLFHQDHCRVFKPQRIDFGCECSTEKSLEAIRALGREDVESLIGEQRVKGNTSLVVDCHFCFQRYEFDFNQIRRLLLSEAVDIT